MALLSEEIAAYETMRDTLEVDYLGKWVVIHDDSLIGAYEIFEEAAKPESTEGQRKRGEGATGEISWAPLG